MKKFLAFLLIAIVACTTVEDLTFESFWDKIKDWFKKAVNWLKEIGVYDIIVNTLITLGKQAAIGLCSNFLSQDECESIINSLL